MSLKKNPQQSGRPGMVYERRPAPIRYKGASVPDELAAWWSTSREEASVPAEESLRRDAIFAALRDHLDVVRSPASIKALREKLGLTQREASDLLGGGPNSFQKYENGTVEISQAMLNLLRLLANDPARLKELEIDENALPKPIPHKPKRSNRTFSLWRRKGLSDADIVVVTADGLKSYVMLVELKRKSRGRDWSHMVYRTGVRRNGKAIYRRGPLDSLPIEEIVDRAMSENNLDPESARWRDILSAANET